MMIRAAVCALALTPNMAPAGGHEAEARALAEALHMPEIIDVIRLEGLAYGDQIAADLFPGPAPVEWPGLVAGIYDQDRLEEQIIGNFVAALSGADIAPMHAFYTTEPGQTIIRLEAETRRARLDPEVEQGSIESAALAAMERTPRFSQIEEMVTTNDLIESNVVAAMNFNYAFYLGLIEGGAMGGDVTESQILSDVWSQEDAIRAQTGEWIYSFYHMAYGPLPDEALDIYLDFARTEAGQTLDKALVRAFEPVFLDISRALGLAAADMMTVQEL